MPRRFFQSLLVPCGVFWGGGGKESPVKHGVGGASTGGGGAGGGTGGEGPGGGELDGCIMHRVHTSNIQNVIT
jgi:hypothetical protein